MKMQKEHYEQLKTMIEQSLAINDKTIFEIQETYECSDLSEKRMRWDLLYSVPYKQRSEWFDKNEIYKYLDDDHIDTALRQLTKEMKTVEIPEDWFDPDFAPKNRIGVLVSCNDGKAYVQLQSGEILCGDVDAFLHTSNNKSGMKF